jgi:XTP/dITP diphosphohydrolase
VNHAGPRLVVASRNRGKVEEVRRLLSQLGLEVRSLDEAGVAPGLELPEPHETFAENALSKARALQGLLGGWALGDDSGLEVDALGGAPGVRSARFAGVAGERRDAANNAKLLQALQGVEADRRTARFVCCLALVGPAGEQLAARGTCEGTILEHPRGQGGFGYDPLFLPAGCTSTMAELGLDEKNGLSHRGQALQHLCRALRARLGA